jgi:glycerophosphoryl diester phosphodiesterase
MVVRIGHRWACWYAPENTLKSFNKAIELDVDMIEFDIHLCKTWEIIVMHDPTVDRTTNGTWAIKNLKYNQIKKLNAWDGEKILTLEETLDCILPYCNANIEIVWTHLVKPLIIFLENYFNENSKNNINKIFISSFRHKDLLKFHDKLPNINISILIGHLPCEKTYFDNKQGIFSFNMDSTFISRKFIKKAHDKWFKVFSYTANDDYTVWHLKKIWIDGIFSNYPDIIKK